ACVSRGFMVLLFFFSSRRRHTRFSRDWSSDVCSSDLTFLARIESITVLDNGDDAPESATALLGSMKILVPMAGLIDKQAELARQIGRASCRERVQISGRPVALKKNSDRRRKQDEHNTV